MNELLIATAQATYYDGQTVYGGVYLKVVQPTMSTGVSIKLTGVERYHCRPPVRDESEPAEEYRVLQDCKEYISESLTLYESRDPISLGHYVFPFAFKLPENCPGTFHHQSQAQNWEAEIVYNLEAELIGSKTFKTLPVIVRNRRDPATCFKFTMSTCSLPKISKPVDICACINENFYTVGDMLSLDIEFSSECDLDKLKVDSIAIELRRCLVIKFPMARFIIREDAEPVKNLLKQLSQKLSCSAMSGFHNIDDPNPTWFLPEGPKMTTYRAALNNEMAIPLRSGIKNCMIPLAPTQTQSSFPPTTCGHFLFCSYYLDVTIRFHKKTVSLTIPIPGVYQSGTMVAEPRWASDCEMYIMPRHADLIDYAEQFKNLPKMYNKIRCPTVLLD